MTTGFHPPLSVIATWPKPNYIDPETKGKELFVISLILCILAVVFVTARLVVRGRIQRQLGLDDYLLAIGLVFSVGQTALFSYTEFRDRWYRHVWDVPLEDHEFRQLHSWLVQLLFVVSTSCTKTSILLLYKRVIEGTVHPRFMMVVKLAIASILAYFIVFFLLMFLQCRPTESYWRQFSFPDKYEADYTCFFEGHLPTANAFISVITDFMTALLPIFLFVQVQLPIRQKISLGILFGVGLMVCVLGIVRTVIVYRLFHDTYDVSWVCYYVWVFTVTENHLGVICAAIPPLRALVGRFLSRHSRSTQRSRLGGHPTNNGSGYMLSKTANGSRQPPAIYRSDIFRVDSVSGDEYLTNSSKTSKPLPRLPSRSRSSDEVDIDMILDVENGYWSR